MIAGASGYLGQALTSFLLEEGCQVIALSRSGLPFRCHPQLSHKKWEPLAPVPLPELPEVDVVYNLACPSMGVCDQLPDISLRSHVEGTLCLLSSLRLRGPFVHLSSCSVYGRQSGTVDENTPPRPISPYGQTKLAAEQALMTRSWPFPVVVVRLATVYGVAPIVRTDLIVNRLVSHGVATGEVVVKGPEHWRAFIHVFDACQALWRLVQSVGESGTTVLCLGNPQQVMTLRHVGEVVALAIPAARLVVGSDDHDVRSYRIRFDKMTALLGTWPSVALSDGIAGLVGHFSRVLR